MLQQFLGQIPRHLINQVDDLSIDVPSADCREDIQRLLKRSVLVGGKRLRPLLTAMMGNFFGTPWEETIPLAQTIELIHASSLAHDDVVDNATSRRGIPSINIQASNKKAVLAGDYLLADVIDHLSKLGNVALLRETSKVIKQLAVGEWLQADAAKDRRYDRQLLEDIARHKTASVMSWCTVAPAVWMNLPTNVVELARQYGTELGLAFQLMDDTLDFSENSKKDLLLDLKNGQVNTVVYEWLMLHPHLWQAYQNGQELQELWSDNDLQKAIDCVRLKAVGHLTKARELLQTLHLETAIPKSADSDRRASLIWLMDYLENRQN
jgi:geranylgeranyl pyrophosphate synthase